MNTTALALMFVSASNTLGLPSGLLGAICKVESGWKVDAIHHDDGGSDSIGICEIKLTTAKEMGFKGDERELKIPQINIYYSGKYLFRQLTRYDGDVRKAVAAYNAGSFRTRDGRNPVNNRYVQKVFKVWDNEKVVACE